ncbi:MAG: hypothetical protein RL538_378 [Candidatus Parcubacteria bacterium]|jgi:DNA-binding response OmpR family regulator
MTSHTILVVEDSPDLADSLYDLLEMNDFTPIIARNGKEGLALALEKKPDLVILDIRLPDIDGYEVYSQIRQDAAWGKTAKVLILTASESIENISKNVDLPIKYVLFKPELSVAELVEHIKERLAD